MPCMYFRRFADWIYEVAFTKDDDLMQILETTRQKALKKIEQLEKRVEILLKQ